LVLASLLEAGACPVWVHWQTPPDELARMAGRVGGRGILRDAESADHADRTNRAVHDLSVSRWANLLWADTAGGSDRRAPHGPALAAVPLHPTSGTTGLPKLAARPGPCAIAEARHYVERIGIDARDTILALSPMSHAYAYGMCGMVPLVSGASLMTMRQFRAKRVVEALQNRPRTILPAVPVMLEQLLFGTPPLPNSPERRVLSAGTLLPERTARAFAQKWQTPVRPLYGTTETGGISVVEEGERDLPTGCVGRPMRGVEVRIAATGDAAELGEGVGRLFVRSSSTMAGYLSDTTIDASPLVDGWFDTGDLARWDEAGRICLLGRQTEVINVYGMKVVPVEVEEVICLLPEVVEAKVYAGQDRGGSQFVKAAVVASESVDPRRIRAHCEKHLVYYKQPKTILLVDRLAKTPSGKVIRDQLP
jgi:acyl-CoA synthetase (AMP-forming)/AMP-acid ligase II